MLEGIVSLVGIVVLLVCFDENIEDFDNEVMMMVYKVIYFIDNIDKVRDLCYMFYFFNLM